MSSNQSKPTLRHVRRCVVKTMGAFSVYQWGRWFRAERAVLAAMAAFFSLTTSLAAQSEHQPTPQQGQDAGALARAVQNPVANLISVPFQNNANFNYGPQGHTQNILNIQPVIPFSISEDWNLITRTIVPVIAQPTSIPGLPTTWGIGAVQFSTFLSPARSHGVTWGAGTVVQIPTTTDEMLGSRIWGAGPTFVALVSEGPWVVGGLVNNIWSFGGDGREKYNNFTFQPFVNYNFPESKGTYLSFSPIITANWEATGSNRWTVPLGLSVGQIFHIGHQPVNAQIGAYYNVARPDNGPEWQLRAQLQLLFPR